MLQAAAAPQSTSDEPVAPAKPARLMSLDAYRGFIMLAMASAGLGIGTVVKKSPDTFNGPIWQTLAFHVEHVPWIGCSFWDLIQPSFMFMVGVAMPYSYAGRRQRGDSYASLLGHVLIRSIVLVALGVFLSSNWDKQTNFAFMNVLSQIGLGYLFVFLFMGRSVKVQVTAIAAIIVGYWLLFAAYPLPSESFDYKVEAGYSASDVDSREYTLPGFWAHWNKNANFAADFDRWFLNLFPRMGDEPFVFNKGGYQTLNFIPSIATMLLGLMAGEMLRSSRSSSVKFRWLVVAGAVCLVLGLASGWTVCPVIKRIWTPSWVLASGAATFWLLAVFYGLIDLPSATGLRTAAVTALFGRAPRFMREWLYTCRFSFPLVVVGMNSIVMYMLSQLTKSWTRDTIKIHFGYFDSFGPILNPFGPTIWNGQYGPIVQSASTLLMFWLFCWWLYRQKIFVRI
jgi:predicted acyltransferase